MNSRLKAEWIEALRSGKYAQLTPAGSHWKVGDRYCCLGVLAELAGLNFNSLSRTEFAKLGFTASTMDRLVTMNDGDVSSFRANELHPRSPAVNFEQIADWIEKNL